MVVVLVATACGGGEAERSPEPTGVLDAYLDEIYESVDAETYVAQHDAVEEYIAACMAEAGFEYRPTKAPPQYTIPELTPAYAAEFGYGETTEAYGPDVPPSRFSQMPGDDPAADFNEDYAYGLSADAQEQYWLAMHGADVGPDGDPEARSPEEAGCRSNAFDDVLPHWQIPSEYRALEDAIREEIWWVDEEPRVVATHPAWAECMAEAGYPGLSAVPDAAALVNDRANGSNLSIVMPWAEMKERFADELAAMQQYEIEVAVADAACREESGWYDVRADVLAEAHASILERYRPELDALVEWVRENRPGTD